MTADPHAPVTSALPARAPVDAMPGGTATPAGVATVLDLISEAAISDPAGLGDIAGVWNPYRQFLEAVGVAVYTTDAKGRLTFFNQAASTLWGYHPTLGEQTWCGSYRLFWPDGQPMPHEECPMATALIERRAVRGREAILERPDGSRIWFTPYPNPLLDEHGELIGGVNVLIDVTERRLAEDALRESAERLRLSNAVKDEFLGLVSHELRTPVTTIFGNARLLRDRGRRLAEIDRRSMISDIATDAERLLGIIENLLVLARVGAGEDISSEPQILRRVIQRPIETFERRRRRRTVHVDVEPGELIVDVDRTYFELVLENLLSNADKYSPAGATIEVRAGRSSDSPGEAVVSVSDRGIGLEGDPETLFAPFRRGDAARARAGGMGIGLAVCRRVLESFGGRIWAEPRAGGGSTFAFSLPLLAEPFDELEGRAN